MRNTHRNDLRVAALLLLAVATFAIPAAANDDRGGEFGVITGFTLADENMTGLIGDGRQSEFSLGVRGGAVFGRHWGWFVDALYTPFDTTGAFGDGDEATLRTGFDLLSSPDRDARWFVNLGGGWTKVDYDTATDFDYPFASLGVGQRILLEGRRHFRWELRADQSLDDEGPFNDSIQQVRALVGLIWGPGGQPTDTDGDGVVDRRDDCPDTPRGAIVDDRGCPKDSDGDGVYDGIDQCPDTPKGWPVNADGCPKDTDGDGVVDGEDACPDTPEGAKVDAKGCPMDSDGDGVYDGIDQCPDTPKGAKVDAKGCPTDSDGDGVYDGIDRCPGTPAGVKVDATGCPEAKLFEEGKKTLVLEGVNFELNRAVLTAQSRSILDRVARSLNEWTGVRVEVGGHTDSTGSESYNQKLSLSRAEAVVEYLASKGVDRGRMTAKGYGEAAPIADNGTTAGRAQNRRVELKRLD